MIKDAIFKSSRKMTFLLTFNKPLLFVYSKPTIEGALVGALFYFCFFFRDLSFLFGDHFGELGFALLSGFGVDVELLPLAVWKSWIKAAFPEVIIDLIDASGARLANLSRDGLGMWLCGLVRCVYGRVRALLGVCCSVQVTIAVCGGFSLVTCG